MMMGAVMVVANHGAKWEVRAGCESRQTFNQEGRKQIFDAFHSKFEWQGPKMRIDRNSADP